MRVPEEAPAQTPSEVTTTREIPEAGATEDSPGEGGAQPALAPPAPVPAGGLAVGHAGGIALEGLSPSGHWVVTCQRADGQELDMPADARGTAQAPIALELTQGATAEPIEALLRADASGRYLVVRSAGETWLIDSVAQRRWSLTDFQPDDAADRLVDHRSFAFSDQHLLILSQAEGVDAYALRLPPAWSKDAASDHASLLSEALAIEVSDRPIYRVEGGPGHARFYTLPQGASAQSWPVPPAPAPVHRCATPHRAFSAFQRLNAYRPDPQLEVAWLPLPDDSTASARGSQTASRERLVAQPAPGFVMASGDSWVRRLDSGRVVLVRGGTQRQITSARCGGRILHGYAPGDTFLIACEEYTPVAPARSTRRSPPKYRFDLHLIRPGFVRSLDADVARTGVDVLGERVDRYLPLRPGAITALVDFRERRLVELDGEARVLATGQGRALIRRGGALSLFIGPGRLEENVDLPVDDLTPILSRGRVAAVGNWIVDLSGDVRSWELPRAPIALSPSAHALLVNEPGAPDRWARGPMVLIGPPSPAAPDASLDPPSRP